MSKLTGPQKAISFLAAVATGVVACGPMEDRPTVGGASSVDTAPTALFDDTSATRVEITPSGEIPLSSPDITGSLPIEPAQEPVSTEPAPYVPDSYVTYAQGRGLDIPSNVSPEVDAQFREFYSYVFNQQFEITNSDGTVTIGSLLSASNPDIDIFIAPDGTLYVRGAALDNDPAFGGGDHHLVIIWHDGSIASLKISKLIGAPSINGFGNYTAQSPEGITYNYNPETNSWAPAASLAPTALPTGTPVPTPTEMPKPTATLTPPPVLTTPAFQNEGGGEVLMVDYGVPGVESPVPATLLQTYEDPDAVSKLDPNAIHVLEADDRGVFTAVVVYPAYIKELRIYQAKITIDGVTYEVKFADLVVAYLTNSGDARAAIFRVFDGFGMKTEGHDVSELPELLGDSITITTGVDFSAPATDPKGRLDDILLGVTRATVATGTEALDHLNNGQPGVVPGATFNIQTYSP